MGDGVFTIALGQTVELYKRVKNNDPAGCLFRVTLWTGTITDATLRDMDDIAEIEASTLAESVATNYVRKSVTDTELAAVPSPDDANDRYEVDMPDQTWSSLGNGANSTLTRLIIAFDATGSDTDANMLPVTFYDFSLTTDGSDVIAQIDPNGFFRAAAA